MIDWLMNGDIDQVLASTPDGALTYGEMRGRLSSSASRETTVLAPGRDIESVMSVFTALASGPLVIRSGSKWSGYRLPADTMTVIPTSGTTGEPKLVPLSHGNWRAAVTASASHLDHTADDQWLTALPLHHVGGLAVLFRSAYVGGRVRMLPVFDAKSFADELGGATTIASVVPTMLRRMLDLDDRPYQGLRAVLVGGGPIPPGLLEEAAARGFPVLPTYGMTETCGQAATLKPGSPLGYRAHLLPDVEARISPDGRIKLRGPQVFSGYLGDKPRDPGEWFVTGDVGELDEQGTLKVTGRADDVIVTGGENVDPLVVEDVVSAHPDVHEAMVVGIPSDEWGSTVVCLFVGAAEPETLRSWSLQRLKSYQVPKKWVHIPAIPRTELGKPDREQARGLAVESQPYTET